MSKDPAALVYIDRWITATSAMKADERAWYFDMIMHQFDKGSIPNDEDSLAQICRVAPSEYTRFNQVLNQVLKQKFKQNDNQTLENEFASEIIQSRNQFKKKRTSSANIGVVVKRAKSLGWPESAILKLKSDLNNKSEEEIEQAKDKQVLEQMLKLYIDVDVDKDIIEINKINVSENEIESLDKFMDQFSIPDNQRLNVGRFISAISNQGLIERFQDQTEAYLKFKNEKDERIHGWKNYIGKIEEQFENAPWMIEDYTSKIKTEKESFDIMEL